MSNEETMPGGPEEETHVYNQSKLVAFHDLLANYVSQSNNPNDERLNEIIRNYAQDKTPELVAEIEKVPAEFVKDIEDYLLQHALDDASTDILSCEESSNDFAELPDRPGFNAPDDSETLEITSSQELTVNPKDPVEVMLKKYKLGQAASRQLLLTHRHIGSIDVHKPEKDTEKTLPVVYAFTTADMIALNKKLEDDSEA